MFKGFSKVRRIGEDLEYGKKVVLFTPNEGSIVNCVWFVYSFLSIRYTKDQDIANVCARALVWDVFG